VAAVLPRAEADGRAAMLHATGAVAADGTGGVKA
jgi:hypothetical protein